MPDSRHYLTIALTLAGAAGLVVPFVPFTYGVVPFTDVLLDVALDDSLWQMAAPTIVLPLPILAGNVLRAVKRDSGAWLDKASYVLALAAMFVFLIGASENMEIEGNGGLWSAIVLLSTAAFGGGLWSSRHPGDASGRGDGLQALRTAYLVPTAFWIAFAFSEDRQPGAWLALIAVLAYALQVLAMAPRRRYTLLVVLPLTALAALVFSVE